MKSHSLTIIKITNNSSSNSKRHKLWTRINNSKKKQNQTHFFINIKVNNKSRKYYNKINNFREVFDDMILIICPFVIYNLNIYNLKSIYRNQSMNQSSYLSFTTIISHTNQQSNPHLIKGQP